MRSGHRTAGIGSQIWPSDSRRGWETTGDGYLRSCEPKQRLPKVVRPQVTTAWVATLTLAIVA